MLVAEGVETDDEAEILLDLECDQMQGYLIARPMPSGGVRTFLEAYEAVPAGALRAPSPAQPVL